MELNRKPTIIEQNIIDFLIKKSTIDFPSYKKENLLVQPMSDGNMGSLLIIPKELPEGKRKFGKRISEYQYKDMDDVDVIISLNVDDKGYLFELDIWKTDFSQVIEFPNLS